MSKYLKEGLIEKINRDIDINLKKQSIDIRSDFIKEMKENCYQEIYDFITNKSSNKKDITEKMKEVFKNNLEKGKKDNIIPSYVDFDDLEMVTLENRGDFYNDYLDEVLYNVSLEFCIINEETIKKINNNEDLAENTLFIYEILKNNDFEKEELEDYLENLSKSQEIEKNL